MSSSAIIYQNGVGCNDDDDVSSPLENLLASLDQVCQKISPKEEDHLFLSQLLQNRNLQSLVLVHDRIDGQELQPVYEESSRLAKDVKKLVDVATSLDAIELSILLARPHLKAVLQAHDQVARKDFLPPLPNVPFEVDEDDECVKVVQLIKNTEPLGATIKINEASDAVVVSRIVQGSVADRSGLISVGDELREVNGICVKGKSPQDILTILQCKEGTITFKLVPGVQPKTEPSNQVRANFSYDPCLDPDIPSKDAGLAYRRGDILHIVSRDDPDWWKAHLDSDLRIGFIPSMMLQKRRMSTAWQNGSLCIKDDRLNDFWDPDAKTTPAYREVSLLFPSPGSYRLIVLIGAPGVGRNELKQRILAYDPVHFKTTVPYTSRSPRPWEEEGKDYYFVSRDVIDEGMKEGKFIDYGVYRGNLYGTCLDTVYTIVRSGRVCILNPHPQTLKLLCTAELKPYIIFIKPPPFELLKETRSKANAISPYDENYSRGFTDKELQNVIDNSWKIERVYGHMFDCVLVNEEINKSVQELLTILRLVEAEPHWAPAEWVLSS